MAPYPKYRTAASFPAMDEPAHGFRFGALAHRNFRLFFLGQGVSLIGTWMQNVGQGWLVLELTNSPFYVGLVSALGSLGVLLLTIYAGVVVDRNARSEEHTSELQSRLHLVCRLLLEKKKKEQTAQKKMRHHS